MTGVAGECSWGGAPASPLELEVDRDAAAAGVFDDLLGLVAESVSGETASKGAVRQRLQRAVVSTRTSAGADTKANTIWGGGALQLLEHTVPLDAARDNDGGGNAQPLAREVDLLCRLCALELVDMKCVDTVKGITISPTESVHTAKGRGMR